MITDGAWATELHKRGLPRDIPSDLWNLERPQEIVALGRAYVDAGSQVILTNTFRANRASLPGLSIQRINQEGVRLAREAAADRARVYGSIGPVGPSPDCAEAYEEQAASLSGADALLIETATSLEEARVALRSALRTRLPVIVSFAFDLFPDLEHAVAVLEGEGAGGIGANCGSDIESMAALCRRLRAATAIPIWMKPNAGLPETGPKGVRYRQTPQQFAGRAAGLFEAGSSFIGGCCGTSPEFIRALAEVKRQCGLS